MSKCACMCVCTFPYITLVIDISFLVGAYNFTYFRLKLPPHSHLWCTEVVKVELTKQLHPSSCGRSVVTHITLQYCVVPPSVDWCCVSLSTTALSSGLLRGSFSCVLHDAPKKCTSFDKLQRSVKYTYVCSHKCVLAYTHMYVSSVRKSYVFFMLFLHRL